MIGYTHDRPLRIEELIHICLGPATFRRNSWGDFRLRLLLQSGSKTEGEIRMFRFITPLTLAAAALAACQTGQTPSSTGAADTHEAMTRINPAALAVWDVTNNAMSEEGELDPALMSDSAWAMIQEAAEVMELHARNMAEASVLWVGAHNDEVEGFATRAEIQAMIDSDPDGFRELSRQMADHSRELAVAAKSADAQQTLGLAESLSERCQTCHTRYWEKPSA